jgi:hypothetical protein
MHDLDGTLSQYADGFGVDPGSWMIHDDWTFNLWDGECELHDKYQGYVCHSNVSVRRLLMYNFAPGNLHNVDVCVI